jgi:hypothetical protein
MATIRQFELPDNLFHSIERRASFEGISVEALVVREMTEIERTQQVEEDSLLGEIRRDRVSLAAKGVTVSDDLIREAVLPEGL